MSNEINIRTSLKVRATSGNILVEDYQSSPTSFNADQTIKKGPTPGVVSVSTHGTDVNFTELTLPGVCRIMNQDPTNYVTYGVWDGLKFHPFGEILPGESYVLRLSRFLEYDYSGGGTGSLMHSASLRLLASTAACNVLVEAFDS